MKNSISILYSFPLRIGVSGIGTTAWYQVSSLSHKNLLIHLFSGTCEKNFNSGVKVIETLRPFRFRIPIKPIGKYIAAYFHDLYVSRYLKKNNKQIDILHCWPSGSMKSLKIAKEYGVKTVLERPNSHTRYAYNIVKNEYKKMKISQNRKDTHYTNYKHLRYEEELYSIVDLILCPSNFVAKTFIMNGIKKEKLSYHHYGYDQNIFYPNKLNEKENKNLKIAFIGRCEPRKGLHYALDAWIQSDASKEGIFYICGSFLKNYKKILNDYLNYSSIRVLGFVENISEVLNECDALILPSIEEGSALVTYEAMACGATLLISNATGAHATHMRDSLIHNVGDTETLKKHLNILNSNIELKQRLKRNSLNNSKKLTWDDSATKIDRIYRDLLENNLKTFDYKLS